MVRVMVNFAFAMTADWLPDGAIFVWKSQAGGNIGTSGHLIRVRMTKVVGYCCGLLLAPKFREMGPFAE